MSDRYTPEEIAEFKAKDRRIVTQNALSHATQIVLNSYNSTYEVKDAVPKIKEVAKELVTFVYEVASVSASSKQQVVEENIPTPTASQHELLVKIASEVDSTVAEITPFVWKWATKVMGQKVFPESVKSIPLFKKWYMENK